MNCNETFNAGICYVTDAYKTVCRFNEELHADLEKYRAENAKLRELVRAAWRCIHTGASCSDCRLIAGGCTLQTAMCELGIEVDG